MRIQFIITDYGSFNNFLGDLAVHLSRSAHKVGIICSSDRVIKVADRYDYASENIDFSFVEFPRGFNFLKHWKASKLIHQEIGRFKPDLVSIHFTTGIFTTTFYKRLPFKTLGTFHGLGYPVVEGLLKGFIYRYVESRSLNRIDEAWVLNKSDHQLLQRDFPQTIVHQLPTKGLGCDLARFDPENFTTASKRDLRIKLNIPESAFVLCYTGRFVFFKGFDKVIRAFRHLVENVKITDLHLLLVGGEDEAHATGLTDYEGSWISVQKNIHRVGFSSEVEKYLSITDLFVFPSEKEGMPVCIIEALAMGVPVLTSDARGCHDLIEHKVNGIISGRNPTFVKIAEDIKDYRANTSLQKSLKETIQRERHLLDRQKFVTQQTSYLTTVGLK